MSKLRWRGACCLENQHVLERVRQMILSADDVRNLQICIVGAGRQVIRGHAVGTEKREVFDIVGGFYLLAVHGIGEAYLFARPSRHPKTKRKRLSRIRTLIGLLAR